MDKFSSVNIIIQTAQDRKEELPVFTDIKQEVIPVAQITKVLISEGITEKGKTGIQIFGQTESGEYISMVSSARIFNGINAALKGAAGRFGEHDLG